MLVDIQNVAIKLLQSLGCDLTAIENITSWKEVAVLGFEFVFACLLLFMLWKMLYNAMIRFFSPKAW